MKSTPHFNDETWTRAVQWLGGLESDYWHKANVRLYREESDLEFAIDKLLEYGRPKAAINCLNIMRYLKKPLNVNQCIKALMAALSSSEPSYSVSVYHFVELIKVLQEVPEVSQNDLLRVEWAYLPILNHYHRVTPKSLENRLASDAEFFCEAIRLIYRAKNIDTKTTELTEKKKAIVFVN